MSDTQVALDRLREVCADSGRQGVTWIETVAWELDRRAERIMELELELELAREQLHELGDRP